MVRVGAGSICAEGDFDFQSGSLSSMTLLLRFPRDALRARGRTGAVLNALTDGDGLTTIPIRLENSIENPTVELGLDSSDIAALIESRGDGQEITLELESFPRCVADSS